LTSARDQRGEPGQGQPYPGGDLVLLSAPPLNAANDNERDLRLVSEEWVSIAAPPSSPRASSGRIALVTATAAIAATIAVGWLFVVALTLFDSLHWVLGFLHR
jgi:hypothetical protein